MVVWAAAGPSGESTQEGRRVRGSSSVQGKVIEYLPCAQPDTGGFTSTVSVNPDKPMEAGIIIISTLQMRKRRRNN